MTTITINLVSGSAYGLASESIRDELTAPIYQMRVKAFANQIYTSAFAVEFAARASLGMQDAPAAQQDHTEYELGSLLKKLQQDPNRTKWPWLAPLYAANQACARQLSAPGGLDIARTWMKDLDPLKVADPTYLRAAIQVPVLVTVGVVAAFASAVVSVAWWARGREDARAAVAVATIKQAASTNALTTLALQYAAAGKQIPPEMVDAIERLGSGEERRSWLAPTAIAVPLVALVGGAGYYGWTQRKARS